MNSKSRLSPVSWLTTKTVVSQVFGIALFAIQAPLLGPRAFGLVSIVLVFVGFCELVIGEAAAESLISIPEITESHYQSMTALNVAVSAAFGVLVFVSAIPVARWLGDAELIPIFRSMAILPVISAFMAAPTAMAKRDMQFQALALRSIVSMFIGGLVGLALTLLGAGVWALVWQALVTRLVAVVVLWLAVPLRLRFSYASASIDDLMKFAMPVMLSRTMSWGNAQIPRLVVGFFWGPVPLGLYGLAARLCDILMEISVVPRYAVARVALRSYAQARAGLTNEMRDLLRNMCVMTFPLCIGGAAVMPTLFHAWLDARWYGGIVPAMLMLLSCAPFVTHYCIGAALLALNQQRVEAATTIAQTALTLLIVPAFAPFGLLPATAAIAARPVLLLPLPAVLLQRYGGVPARAIFGAQAPILVSALLMGAGVTLLRLLLEKHLNSLILLFVLAVTGAVMYGVILRSLAPAFAQAYARGLWSKVVRG